MNSEKGMRGIPLVPTQALALIDDEYQYDFLPNSPQHFRLLKILNTTPHAQYLECSIVTFCTGQAPPYVALSYTWGSAEDEPERDEQENSHSIKIGHTYLNVFENLYYALLELKSLRVGVIDSLAQPGQYLWIDAICINQKSMDERNRQLSIMDLIYSGADRVLVWLGRDLQNTMSIVSDMLSRFSNMAEHIQQANVSEEAKFRSLLLFHPNECLSRFGLPEIGNEQWNYLFAFYRRRWFSRLWILQEVALAREIQVVCGKTTIGWSLIINCSLILSYGLENAIQWEVKDKLNTMFCSRRAEMIETIREWCVTGVLPRRLMYSVRLYTGQKKVDAGHAPAVSLGYASVFSATDSRDRIFAVLGLLKRLMPPKETFTAADYALNKVQIYTDATCYILRGSNWLGFLSNIGATSVRDPRLPPWVQDFEDRLLRKLSVKGSAEFNAAGKFASTVCAPGPELRFEKDILRCTGYKVAMIRARSEPLLDVYWAKSDFEDGIKLILNSDKTYIFTGQSRIEVLWRTLMVDRLLGHPPEEWYNSFVCWWLRKFLFRAVQASSNGTSLRSYIETISNVELLAQSDDSGTLPGHQTLERIYEELKTDSTVIAKMVNKASLYALEIGDWVDCRRLFSTIEGHLGIGHQSIRDGDEVWVLPKAHVPFILRKIPSAGYENRFSLVSECYVHGIMHGEAFGNKEPIWQDITLV